MKKLAKIHYGVTATRAILAEVALMGASYTTRRYASGWGGYDSLTFNYTQSLGSNFNGASIRYV